MEDFMCIFITIIIIGVTVGIIYIDCKIIDIIMDLKDKRTEKIYDKFAMEYPQLDKQIKKYCDSRFDNIDFNNDKIVPKKREIEELRDKLVRSTTKERIELENQIETLIDDCKPLELQKEKMDKELLILGDSIKEELEKITNPKYRKVLQQKGWYE